MQTFHSPGDTVLPSKERLYRESALIKTLTLPALCRSKHKLETLHIGNLDSGFDT